MIVIIILVVLFPVSLIVCVHQVAVSFDDKTTGEMESESLSVCSIRSVLRSKKTTHTMIMYRKVFLLNFALAQPGL